MPIYSQTNKHVYTHKCMHTYTYAHKHTNTFTHNTDTLHMPHINRLINTHLQYQSYTFIYIKEELKETHNYMNRNTKANKKHTHKHINLHSYMSLCIHPYTHI